MKKDHFKPLLVIAGGVLFNIIFWKEKIAVNAVLFDVFLLLAVYKLYPVVYSRPLMKWLLPAHAISMVALLWHNTLLSGIAFCSSLLVLLIFTQYEHRSVWYAAGSAVNNFALSFLSFFENLPVPKVKGVHFGKKATKAIRFLILPLLIVIVFLVIYRTANAVFNKAIEDGLQQVEVFLTQLFTWTSWERLAFLLLGLFITAGLLLKTKGYFSAKDLSATDTLLRRKHNLPAWKESLSADLLHLFMGRFSSGTMALKNEQKVGLICLVLLNALLLMVNLTDIVYVWFGFEYNSSVNLTSYVHEGAGMLIVSILLAMLLLLFFFRGNLNFYRNNKALRYAAYAWIIQNGILVFSVLMRDVYYIRHMGLAYKRIGLFVFLLMVLMGLVSLLVKIKEKKTGYFLWRVNGWFAMLLLIAGSLVNWDEQIATYNLSKKSTIPVDVHFLLSLSDKVLPIIEKNKAVLNVSIPAGRVYSSSNELQYLPAATIFEQRKQSFFQRQQRYSWLSWNLADQQVKAELQSSMTAQLRSK